MREIKFRAWDAKNKQMILTPMSSIYRNRRSLHGDIYIYQPELFGKAVRVELMQYTGLNDKNGREIYEGDLFQWEDDAIGIIKYQDGSFYLETNIALPGDSAHGPGFYSPWLRVIKHELETELEIIGNIYENPELLEGDSN